jgi:hypothetical protein
MQEFFEQVIVLLEAIQTINLLKAILNQLISTFFAKQAQAIVFATRRAIYSPGFSFLFLFIYTKEKVSMENEKWQKSDGKYTHSVSKAA